MIVIVLDFILNASVLFFCALNGCLHWERRNWFYILLCFCSQTIFYAYSVLYSRQIGINLFLYGIKKLIYISIGLFTAIVFFIQFKCFRRLSLSINYLMLTANSYYWFVEILVFLLLLFFRSQIKPRSRQDFIERMSIGVGSSSCHCFHEIRNEK